MASAPASPNNPDTEPTSRRERLFARLNAEDARVLPALLRQETTGGVLMLVATVAALLWANLAGDSYEAVRHTYLGPLNIQHWAADGLLTIFFFVAGLELKRELTSGSLSKPAEALVPIVAAISGMIVPALLYVAVNVATHDGHLGGWAIPMATDIAFALAILAATAPRLPTSLRAFLLTLAIVDDLGAILVIAFVFTETIHLVWLAVAAACAVVWFLLQRRHVDHWAFYVPLFVLAWWAMHESGVHATIAGVLLGLLSRSDADDPHDPVDRWGHFWHPISAGFVVPVFALMSAGVAVTVPALSAVVTEPVGLGIILGLVVGKPLGIFAGAWLTANLTRAQLAADLYWREVLAVAMVGGVGFTVALFVSELAFPAEPAVVETAKAGVLVASLAAGVVGALALAFLSRRRPDDLPDRI
ncbi:Na+/H+ antiporter NhaA [Mariniluteicoccus endophyticus]